MAKPTTVEEAILQTALGPKRVIVGNGKVEAESQDIDDLLKLRHGEKTIKPHFGIRFTRLIPPGGG